MPSLSEAVERHSHHYLSVAQQSATNWQVADTDVAQLRQVWEQRTSDTLDQLMPWARSLSSFYTLRGYWEEERTLKYRTLQAAQQVHNQRIEAWCLHELAYLAERQGHLEEALRLYRQALTLRQALGSAAEIAATLTNLGGVYQRQGQLSEALLLFEQALTVWQTTHNPQAEANVLNSIAGIYQAKREFDRARGSAPSNRGHSATPAWGCFGGRPRRLGGTHSGNGIAYRKNSAVVQQ